MIDTIRTQQNQILVAGNHVKIIQSILDFDYAAGRDTPSVIGIISSGRKTQKFFWGDSEVLVPVFSTFDKAKNLGLEPHFLLCITSAASTPRTVDAFFSLFPEAQGAHLFAEGVAERDALFLVERYATNKLIAGPSGVGLCVPGSLKLGAIGGVSGERVADLGSTSGHTAVICSSGGMVNELMYQVVASGSGISFAACYGGDRFPITSPLRWLLEAENDPQTKEIVYFGELGGNDEYTMRDAVKAGQVTKPIHAYIAGRFESSDENIQFGHAKALAKAEMETATAKMHALQAVGVTVYETFEEFMTAFQGLSRETLVTKVARSWKSRKNGLKQSLFSAPAYKQSIGQSFTETILSRLLCKTSISRETVTFVDLVFANLVDHGPHVSGAVNTMITARGGKDMMSAVAAGVLTIGDRFGGAVNGAAKVWFEAVSRGTTPVELVAEYSAKREYILGIGHRKYSVYKPDSRVADLVSHGTSALPATPYYTYAAQVAELTSQKRANLILNVDGAVASLLMDFLTQKEDFTSVELEELIEIGFFNALFLIPRTAGFVGNYLDQKRTDEGLFRLDDDLAHLY